MTRVRFVSVGPVSSGVRAWSSRGQAFLTVVVKATFARTGRNGELVLADDADPILERDAYHGNNPTRSPSDASDIAPYLGRGEVLYRGAAHGAADTRVRARLCVKRATEILVDKLLEVSLPAEGRLPITYESALGGPGNSANPVGRSDPSILHPRTPELPIGLGPLARNWSARAGLVAPGKRGQMNAPVLAIDDAVSWDYFHAAPPDQRAPGFFQGDETIVLENLGSAGAVELRLPGGRAEARILREGAPPQSVQLACDMLRVDGDRWRLSLTWRGHVAHSGDEPLVVAAGVALDDRAITWPEVDWTEPVPADEPAPPRPIDLNGTAPAQAPDRTSPALPFIASEGDRPVRSAAPQPHVPWRDPGLHDVLPPPADLEHTLDDPHAHSAAPLVIEAAPAKPAPVAPRDHAATREPRTTAIAAIPEAPQQASESYRSEDARALKVALQTAGASSDDIAALVSALTEPARGG